MKRKNYFIISLTILVFTLSLALSGCSDRNNTIPDTSLSNTYSYDNEIIATEYVTRKHLLGSDNKLFSVIETSYDSQIDRYIVSLVEETVYKSERGTFTISEKKEEELEKKIIVVGVTDGLVSSIDLDDGKGELFVIRVTPETIISEIAPGQSLYELNIP